MAKIKKVKKAQNGVLEYTYPKSKTKVRMDTTGYSSGATRFPTKIKRDLKEFNYGPSFGGPRAETNFATNRKGADRMIEATQGKREKPGFPVRKLKGKKVDEKRTGGKITTAKNGKQMLKRADGSVSQRGLWDNIRAAAKRNKAAGKPGKKPTAAMLKQEKKIKAKSK